MSPCLYLSATLSNGPAGIDSQSVIPESLNNKQLPLIQVRLHYYSKYPRIQADIAIISLAYCDTRRNLVYTALPFNHWHLFFL